MDKHEPLPIDAALAQLGPLLAAQEAHCVLQLFAVPDKDPGASKAGSGKARPALALRNPDLCKPEGGPCLAVAPVQRRATRGWLLQATPSHACITACSKRSLGFGNLGFGVSRGFRFF